MKTMINIAKEFALNGNITNIAPYGSGHINSTYLINTDSGNQYILQKIYVKKMLKNFIKYFVKIHKVKMECGNKDFSLMEC